MVSSRAVAVLGVLLFGFASSALSASQRSAVPLTVTAAELAAAVDSGNTQRSTLVLDLVRILFDGHAAPDGPAVRMRTRVLELLRAGGGGKATVPLPLTPKLWCDAILERQVPDAALIAEILNARPSALLYYGLSALDDETLAWLAGNREVLSHLLKHPGAFAAFGRSVRVRDGRVLVPGGAPAVRLWHDVVGADPADASAFVRALFRSDRGRAAFLFDTIAHLDAPRQQFALAGRFSALADMFHDVAREWDPELRPFGRPQLDPSLLLMTVRVGADGTLAPPSRRSLWDRVFRDDLDVDLRFEDAPPWKASNGDDEPADAAWLARRVNGATYTIGRRRLDTLLFGQRVLTDPSIDPHVAANVLRAYAAMPALLLTLERAGVHDPKMLLAAAQRAREVHAASDGSRELAISAFQAGMALVERGVRPRVLAPAVARQLVESLIAIPVDRGRGYDERVAAWMRTDLFRSAPQPPLDSTDPVEEAVLALIAGTLASRHAPVIEWEGEKYRVDPAAAELARLRRVRQRQGGLSLDAAIAKMLARDGTNGHRREKAQREFHGVLVSLLYAPHLGDPEGPALAAANVALRHDLGLTWTRPGVRPMTAWKLPTESFGGEDGWRVHGSLLALDVALRRLSLRRLDSGELPSGPTMPVLERRTAMMTSALANPFAVTDDERDRAVAALARGRQRIAALAADPSRADEIAASAGLSEWRREALKWALVHAPEEVAGAFSLVEAFWAGGGDAALDAWGAAALPVTGCVCLKMPAPTPWENLTGRPAAGALASLGADVNLRIADALSARKLPAALMPAVLALAMQDVLDAARPAYFDDWPAFCRAAGAIADSRIDDYVAALAADGPLVPAARDTF